jgi:hypothetical protein
MTKAAVPKRSWRCGGGEGSGGAGWCWKERVEVTRAIAPGDHAPCLKVLHRKVKWVKFNGAIIISNETMNRN